MRGVAVGGTATIVSAMRRKSRVAVVDRGEDRVEHSAHEVDVLRSWATTCSSSWVIGCLQGGWRTCPGPRSDKVTEGAGVGVGVVEDDPLDTSRCRGGCRTGRSR